MFWVLGSGFWVFGFLGFGFWVLGSTYAAARISNSVEIEGLGFRVWGSRSRVQGSGFRTKGLGFSD